MKNIVSFLFKERNTMIKIYGIKNCDTMKKSFLWLDQTGIAYEFHDYKKLGADAKTIKKWAKMAELKLLINKKGPTFKKLAADKQMACVKLQTAIPIMMEFTSMIKRPIIEFSDEILVGYNPEIWAEKFK